MTVVRFGHRFFPTLHIPSESLATEVFKRLGLAFVGHEPKYGLGNRLSVTLQLCMRDGSELLFDGDQTFGDLQDSVERIDGGQQWWGLSKRLVHILQRGFLDEVVRQYLCHRQLRPEVEEFIAFQFMEEQSFELRPGLEDHRDGVGLRVLSVD